GGLETPTLPSPSPRPHQNPLPKPSLLGFYRSLCSSLPDAESNPQTPPTEQPPPKPQPTLIQPVSYAVKANKPTPPPRQLDHPQNPGARNFTREELRFMTDLPSVSYNTKVAPLPEHIVADNVGVKSEGKEEGLGDDVELERERRRIEADKNRAMRRMPRALEEESLNVPFPTLIKLDKKGDEVVYDLKEAIRLVKVNAKHEFETVEAHKVDGTAALPHCDGKARVAVFAEGGAADEAKAAGADVVGGQELLEEIQKKNERVKGKKGKIKVDFDICIATPQFMSGKWEKVTLPEEALRDNVGAFVNALLLAKPRGLKKSSKYVGYVKAFHKCSTEIVPTIEPLLEIPIRHIFKHQGFEIRVGTTADYLNKIPVANVAHRFTLCLKTLERCLELKIENLHGSNHPIVEYPLVHQANASPTN
ncbi:hypothetical protein RJ640_001692, partial [Escallonia rubra]